MGHRVIGIDQGMKEKLVAESGAEVFLDINKYNANSIVEEVRRITDNIGASSVIVCSSVNAAYAQAMQMLRFAGTLVCVVRAIFSCALCGPIV